MESKRLCDIARLILLNDSWRRTHPWWDPLGEDLCVWAAYRPKGAISFASSLLDLTGNGNHAINLGGTKQPGWNAVFGWTFSGSVQHLRTTFVPASDQSQSVLVQFSNARTSINQILVGMNEGADLGFEIYNSTALTVKYANGGSVTVAPTMAAGNLAIAGDQGYRNGVAEGAAIGAWGGPVTTPVFIGCTAVAGPWPIGYAQTYIQSLVIYDCTVPTLSLAAIVPGMA